MFRRAKHPKVILALLAITPVAILASAIVLDSPQTIAGGPSPQTLVQENYLAHLQSIHSMNITAIQEAYASNATLALTDTAGDTQNVAGPKNIATFFQAFMSQSFALPRFSKMNATVTVSGDTATLYSGLVVNGYNADANQQAAYANLRIGYVRSGTSWLISHETWNFTAAVT